MVATSTPASAAQAGADWTLRGLIGAHKLIALAVAAVLALMVGMVLAAALGPKGGVVTSATTCSQWGSSNQSLQSAYARRYVQAHGGPVAGRMSPASVIGAIDDGCMQAFGEDVADTTSISQAITGNF